MAVRQFLMERKWTSELSKQLQDYYNKAPHLSYHDAMGSVQTEPLNNLPAYQDMPIVQCHNQKISNNQTISNMHTTSIYLIVIRQYQLIVLLLVFIILIIYIKKITKQKKSNC